MNSYSYCLIKVLINGCFHIPNMNSYSYWLIKVLINRCFHIVPAICSRSVIMALGVASGHYSHPRAIITDLEHITGPI